MFFVFFALSFKLLYIAAFSNRFWGQNGILSLTFSTDAYAVSLVVSLICFAEIAKLYHKISVYIAEKIL